VNIVQDDVPVTYALKVIFSVSYWLWDTHNLATDQSLDQWSSAGCWPRFNQTLLQLIDVSHWFLINMFLRVGFSRCLLVLVHWCGFHAARGEPDLAQNRPLWRMMSTYGATQSWVACQKRRRRWGVKVNGAYYCDVLLLKQLLPDICQAAGDFCFPAYHACPRAQNCCDTRLRTSHQTWPPNTPDLSSVDYRLLRVIQECIYQKQQGTSNIVDEHCSCY